MTAFIAYRNEGGADFIAWAEANPATALRRYQVRDTGAPQRPKVTNGTEEEQVTTYEVLVAYPQNARYGDENALDRDDAMRADQLALEGELGPLGGGNFIAPQPDATCRSISSRRREGRAVDFLVMTVVMAYTRQIGTVASVDTVTNLPTTLEALRDHARALVATIAPATLDPFIEFRNEDAGDFREWARDNPAAAFRRFQVRDTGEDDAPTMQTSDLEARETTLELVIAYPQDARAGDANALSRDDLATADELLLLRTLGPPGYGNWTGPDNPNATILGYDVERESRPEDGIDFLVITLRLAYRRAL